MDNNIVLYTTGCPKCKILKEALDEKGVSYKEETDVKLMISMGIVAAPVLGVNGELMDFGKAFYWVNNL